jgi:hypothetical protein
MPIELQELRKQLIYEDTALLDSITTDLDDIAALSQLAHIRQKKFGNQAFYYFIGAAALGFINFSLSTAGMTSTFLTVVVTGLNIGLAGLILACIYAIFMRSKFGRLNLLNYRYALTQQVIEMLKRDLDVTNLIYLKLSFQKGTKNEYKTNTIPHPYKTGWNIDIYQNEWLNIKGRFLDKTRFRLTITELCKKQYGWKRSSSGKNKYKSKIKSGGLDINLHLSYPTKRYGAIKILQNEVEEAIKLPPFATVRNLNVTDKSMNFIVRISPQVSENPSEIYQTVVAMFLSLYQVLNLAKMLSEEKV